MTPRELMLAVEALNIKIQYEQKNLVTQAYLTAAWYRSKKMPTLNRLLADIEPKKREPLASQTDKQMLAAALSWQKRFEREEEN